MTASPVEKFPEPGLQVSIDINSIRIDGGTQPRVQLDGATVAHYADAILHHGDVFPPIDVFFDGTHYWLVDGWHRVCAALCLGWQAIAAEVLPGGLREAEWHSFSVNATHGYPRGSDDVGRILGRIFRDPEWSVRSLREISRHCAIPLTTVHRHYVKVAASVPPEQRKPSVREVSRATSAPYEMETRNIGRQAAPEPSYDDWEEPPPVVAVLLPRDPNTRYQSYPPGHSQPATMIRELVRMLHQQLNLTPAQALVVSRWAGLEGYRTEARAVSAWLATLVDQLPEEEVEK